jgi:transporter family-2 protein
MQALLYPFIIVAGMMQALGAVMSAQLRVSLNNPWLAATVAFAINAFFFLTLFAVRPQPLPTAQGVSNMPFWAPLAGLVGAVAVIAGLLFVDTLGAGAVNGLLICSNLVASLLIDHFAVAGAPQHSLNLLRVLGGALMIGGVVLVSRF